MGQVRASAFWGKVVTFVALAMVLYHLVSTQYLLWGVVEHATVHLGFALVLVFLSTLTTMKRRQFWPLIIALILGSLLVTSYMLLRIDYLMASTGFIRSTIDGVIAILLVIVVTEACRQAWGWTLPIVTMLSVIYFFYGHLLPPPFGHTPLEPAFVLSMLGLGFHGIFGDLLHISANFVILFIVFGGIIAASGAHKFFIQMGRAAGRLVAGGTAQTAVVSSALMGMVLGGSMANVILTGAFTIPLMKKAGYTPEEAGAVEASASCGGQFMPPVMGASAFIIAGFLGMAYVDVAIAAFIPAVLYFFLIGVAVQIMAVKGGIPRPAEKIDMGEIVRRAPLFFIPLGIIYVILMMRFSPMFAAFYAIAAAVLLPYLRKETRIPLGTLVRGFVDGAIIAANMAVALAILGMLVQALNTTGVGVMIAQVVEEVSGGHLWLALAMTMAISIILGIGMPTPAAYVVVSIIVAPALVTMGVVPLAAHFFVFWFAIFSTITPPVALSSMAAASISGGNYWRTSLEALRMVLPGFMLPYLIVYGPALILEPSGPLDMILTLLASLFGLSALVILLHNYLLISLRPWEMLLIFLGTIGIVSYIFVGSVISFVFGIMILSVGVFWHWRRAKTLKQVEAVRA